MKTTKWVRTDRERERERESEREREREREREDTDLKEQKYDEMMISVASKRKMVGS